MFHTKYQSALPRAVHSIRRGAYLCIVKGNCQYSLDLPQHRYYILSKEYTSYLCSNPTNQFKGTSHYQARLHVQLNIGGKKLANCCDSPNSPKFFPLQSFLLYGNFKYYTLSKINIQSVVAPIFLVTSFVLIFFTDHVLHHHLAYKYDKLLLLKENTE